MFYVQNNTLYFTRGDVISFNLSIDGYTFQPEDKIRFRIYEKNRLNAKPVSEVVVSIEEETSLAKITLPSAATRIGKIVNQPVEYWYEVKLNDIHTVIGYDGNGPKVAVVYPEGEANG